MRPRNSLAILALIGLAACESERTIPTHNQQGVPAQQTFSCVGIDGKGKQPGIDYKLSGRNLAVGIFFVEMVVPPVIVAVDETFCPFADTTRIIPPKSGH